MRGEEYHSAAEQPASVDSKEEDDWTSLHIAAENNRTNTDLIKCLLENMSLQCINHSDSDGCTPLDNAYRSNINNEIKDEIIQLIRKHGGISHKYNENGERKENAYA